MTSQQISDFLNRSFEDRRLSRGERQSLVAMLADGPTAEERGAIRRHAFAIAGAALGQPDDHAVLEWLEDVVKALEGRHDPASHATRSQGEAEAHFSPGDDCRRRIIGLFAEARRSVEVCVFTITDDRLSAAILDAHHRRVSLRILTDDEKAYDVGSDVERFRRAGIEVRVDHSPYHMHHKFAIFDGDILLTGSYNWTRGASDHNEENFVVLRDRGLIAPFSTTFERLWSKHAGAPGAH